MTVLFSPKSYNGSRVNKYIYIHVLYKSHINAELTSWKLIHNYDSGNIWQISIFDLTLRIEIPSSQFSNQWGYVHLYVTLTFSVVDVRTPLGLILCEWVLFTWGTMSSVNGEVGARIGATLDPTVGFTRALVATVGGNESLSGSVASIKSRTVSVCSS